MEVTVDESPRGTDTPGEGERPDSCAEPELPADLLIGLRAFAAAVSGSAEIGAQVTASAVATLRRRGGGGAEPADWLLPVVANRAVARGVRRSRDYLPVLFAECAGRRGEASILAVRSVLADLPPADRAAVLLRYLRLVDDATVARTLGWPRTRLSARLYAAMSALGAAVAAAGPGLPTGGEGTRWDLIGAAAGDLVARVPDRPDQPPARPRRRWRPWLAAAATLVPGLLALGVLVTSWLGLPGAPGAVAHASAYLPSRLPAYSLLTGYAGSSPPGPAVLAWEQGAGVELVDTEQFLVLGEGGDVMRRVAEAEAGAGSAGRNRPALLAPDGRSLALGTVAGNGVIELVDLTTGRVSARSPLGRGDVWPAAWDPRGDVLWVVRVEDQAPERAPLPSPGQLVRISVEDASSTELTGLDAIDPSRVVISPDGGLLAVQEADQRVLDTATLAVVATWDLDADLLRNGWSPDASRLVVGTPSGLAVVTVSGTSVLGTPQALPGIPAGATVLAWRSDTEVLLAVPEDGEQPRRLVAVDVTTGESRVVSVVLRGWQDAAVGEVSMATALAPGLTFGPPGPVDRGAAPWPWWVPAALLVLGGVLWGRRIVGGARRRLGSLRW